MTSLVREGKEAFAWYSFFFSLSLQLPLESSYYAVRKSRPMRSSMCQVIKDAAIFRTVSARLTGSFSQNSAMNKLLHLVGMAQSLIGAPVGSMAPSLGVDDFRSAGEDCWPIMLLMGRSKRCTFKVAIVCFGSYSIIRNSPV
jgi:hypothetical protein